MDSVELTGDEHPFTSWLSIIESRFSIQIDALLHAALHSALQNYATTLGCSLADLEIKAKESRLQPDHWSMILHLATNHETRFYRSPAALRLIVDIAKNLKSPRILSVGCSTGEEPYSIAVELLNSGSCSFRIHATDISPLCIETAKAGLYPKHKAVTQLAAASIDPRHMRFHAWVREMITFEQHNILLDRPIEFTKPNIVLTQNMLIYYRPETRFGILDRLANLLEQGGYLITGPAETLSWPGRGLIRHLHPNLTVFQRSADV